MRMKKWIYVLMIGMLGCVACSTEDDVSFSDEKIQVAVSDALQIDSRAYLFNDSNAHRLQDEAEFALDAYIRNTPYINGAWVSFIFDEWRFQDIQHPGTLFDFFWPSDGSKVDFLAYAPRDLFNKFLGTISDITHGMSFTCTLPETIDVSTSDKLDAVNNKREFIYAYRTGLGRSDKPVDLCFVHPFACIRFKLKQGHRDLTVHDIILNDIALQGKYTNTNDTKITYASGQSGLTTTFWNELVRQKLTMKIERDVPNGIQYGSWMGPSLLVIPQALTGVSLQVKYTWISNTNEYKEKTTDPFNLPTITQWEPGKIYTYTLDLGDNKAEILFNVEVEEWKRGEDDGKENYIEVK